MMPHFRRAFWISLPAMLLVAAALAGGCNNPPAANGEANDGATNGDNAANKQADAGSVGIVNLDEVAQELGLTQQLQQILAAQNQQLQRQLNNVQSRVQTEFEAKLAEFGEERSDAEEQELQQMRIRNTTSLQTVQRQAQERSMEMQRHLIGQIRATIKGSVEKVAKRHGFTVVLSERDDMLVYTAEGVDITKEVIAIAQEEGVQELSTEGVPEPAPAADPSITPETTPEIAPEPEPVEEANGGGE